MMVEECYKLSTVGIQDSTYQDFKKSSTLFKNVHYKCTEL